MNLRPLNTSRHGQADLPRTADPEAVVRSDIAASLRKIAVPSFGIGPGCASRHPATALRRNGDLAAPDSSLREEKHRLHSQPEDTLLQAHSAVTVVPQETVAGTAAPT